MTMHYVCQLAMYRVPRAILLGAMCVLLNGSIKVAKSHTDLGLHALNGETPAGDPPLIEIDGPFEVEVKVRFNSIGSNNYQTIFEYSTSTLREDVIWFGQQTGTSSGDNVAMDVGIGLSWVSCSSANPGIVTGRIYTYKFGVDAAGSAKLYQDGILVTTCTSFNIPNNVPRNHFLGNGIYSDQLSVVDPLEGAILGLRVTNLSSPQTPGEAMALQSFPSQTFSSGFTASFYARFDRINNGLQWQRVFDFGNGEFADNLLCGQLTQTTTFYCALIDDVGTIHDVYAPSAITVGEMAFWHFEALDNGAAGWTFRLFKNNVLIKEDDALPPFQLSHVFRKPLIGESHWPTTDDDLYGVVLGLRVDRRIVS